MKAARVNRFGPPEAVVVEDIPRPTPGPNEVLVRVVAAGVGPWDALIREGQSEVTGPAPLTPGSDLSGVVEAVGSGVTNFIRGNEVYGVTNPQFIGAHAEYGVADAGMIARKPANLNYLEAASVPVVAVTAWQMLFEYAQVQAGQTVLILGGAGNVGAYAVQLASQAGIHVIATAAADDLDSIRKLGADTALDYRSQINYASLEVDAVIDTVGGPTEDQAEQALKPGGILVTVVTPHPTTKRSDLRSVFFYVEVTTARLDKISALFAQRKLATHVGSVLPLDQALAAHEMLAGAPHKPGKIVLQVQAG
jgi:NADPH:quinone reductase-like Zn-dependent oxidoreductase